MLLLGPLTGLVSGGTAGASNAHHYYVVPYRRRRPREKGR